MSTYFLRDFAARLSAEPEILAKLSDEVNALIAGYALVEPTFLEHNGWRMTDDDAERADVQRGVRALVAGVADGLDRIGLSFQAATLRIEGKRTAHNVRPDALLAARRAAEAANVQHRGGPRSRVMHAARAQVVRACGFAVGVAEAATLVPVFGACGEHTAEGLLALLSAGCDVVPHITTVLTPPATSHVSVAE